MKMIKLLGISALLMGVMFLASGCSTCNTGACGAPAPCSPCGR